MHGIFLSSCVPHRETGIYRPLGPYRVASHLRDHGYNIQVIDFVYALSNDQIEILIEKFITSETKFIGFGMMVDVNNPRINSLKKKFAELLIGLRKKYPQLKFIIGGPNIHAWSGRFVNGSLFDYYIKGYGEDQTLALFNHIIKGQQSPPFEIIEGNKHLPEHLVTEKIKYFNFTKSRHRWHISDCIQPGESLPIEFARGCIFKCSFCRYPHIGKSKYDFIRDLDCIRDELIYNYENFGTTIYFVTDDTFNADHQFVYKFTDMVKTLPFKLGYMSYIRADLLHARPEQEDMFLENGLISTFFGIESFNTENAKIIGKAWSGKHAKEYIPELYHNKWKKQIHLTIGMIAGLPHENLEDLKLSNRWFMENQISCWNWHPLDIDRMGGYYKSEFDENAEKYGYKFKLQEGKPIWYTDTCDEFKAVEWATILQNEVKHRQKPSTWSLAELSTLGLKTNTTANTILQNINWGLVQKRYKQFLEKYFNDLLSL